MTFLAILLGLLPGFAWLLFYLRESSHREPKRVIVKAVAIGALFAFVALIMELFVECGSLQFTHCSTRSAPNAVHGMLFIIAFAFIEEAVKFVAAYIAVHESPAMEEPVDAMIYLVAAAMGFATVENIGALTIGNGVTPVFFGELVGVASLRFVGATLLHSLASATMGYFWALSIRSFGAKEYIAMGLIVATGLHAIFNMLLTSFDTIVYPLLLLTVMGFFVLTDFETLRREKI